MGVRNRSRHPRASLSSAQIAEGIRTGALDVARDLRPEDLEALLRDPRLRSGFVETPKNICAGSTYTPYPELEKLAR